MNLKTIAPTWEVQETQNGNVAVPVNPYKWCDTSTWHPRSFYTIMANDDFEKLEKALASLPTIFTDLSPGTYKAEDLGEVVWQHRNKHDDGEWMDASQAAYDYAKTFERFKEIVGFFEEIETRLFLPSPTNLTNK